MSVTVLNRVLLVVIAALALLAWLMRRDFSQPNYVFTPEMVFSVPYDSFAPNPNYGDGKTLQLPVQGTIARGTMPLDYEATEADAIRAGKELISPWRESGIDADALMAAKSRGRKVYSIFCLPCHGAVGNGDGPVSMHGFPPPPSLSQEKTIEMSDGQMFHILTFGQKNMPAYAAQIDQDDRWKAILHVRSIQDAAIRKIEADRRTAASIESGKQLFDSLNCNKCHTVSADEKPQGPYLGKVAAAYTREQLSEAIQHPSKTIADGFLMQVFLTVDGRTHSGFVTGETDEQVTIRNADGNEIIIPIEDIDDRRTLEKSPMPDGLIKDLDGEQLTSLLDYLQSIADDTVKQTPDAKQSGDDVPDSDNKKNADNTDGA